MALELMPPSASSTGAA